MSKNPVNWFELPVANIERACGFYEKILGLSLSRQNIGDLIMAWFPMENGGDGSTGTLIQNQNYTPSHEGTMIYFSVKNIDDVLKKVETNGGKIVSKKSDVGEFGYVGHFEDTEGNRVGLHSDS